MEKLIYFYEESLSFEFKIFDKKQSKICILNTSKNPLNLLFFKALLKFVVVILKKGCYKSALEFNKFLLKLNPIEDPQGALIMIDHCALSASNYKWFINFSQNFGTSYYFNEKKSILLYPNILFSYALALFRFLNKRNGFFSIKSKFS